MTDNKQPGWMMVNAGKLLPLLREIKDMWDVAGFGEDAEQSERVYRELCNCIEQLEPETGGEVNG